MRVVGKKGSINEGAVFDIQDVSGRGADALGGKYDDYEELDPADDPGKSAIQVANASVRGDYTMNPAVDEVEQAKLDEIDDARAVVHANKAPAKAKKGKKD